MSKGKAEKPTTHVKVERLLVREVNWLGDVVMSLPALKALRKAYPKAKLSILVKRELAGFFDGAPWMDEVIPFRIGRGFRGWTDRRNLVAELRNRTFDLAVLLPNSFESAFWTWRARIPARAGYARDGRGLLLTHKLRPSHQILEAHQVHYYLHLLRETLGIDGDPKDFAPHVHDGHREKMRAWLRERRERPGKKLIALAVAAAYGPAKEWPADYFATLIDRLAENHGAECVLVGAPSERSKCEQVAALSEKKGAILAAGETGVGEAIALLSLCDGFAGNDSGSMHLAGALGMPTVGIFGSTRADRTGPLGARTKVLYRPIECSPCLERTCRFGHYSCLKQITPEEVEAALVGLEAL
jgi:heptosyltransferase-2